MTQYNNIDSMQRDARRRVYDMQQRAQNALRRSNDAQSEPDSCDEETQSTCPPITQKQQSSITDQSKDIERILILLLAIVVMQSKKSSAIAMALLYLCF